jgi:hypothetical protein
MGKGKAGCAEQSMMALMEPEARPSSLENIVGRFQEDGGGEVTEQIQYTKGRSEQQQKKRKLDAEAALEAMESAKDPNLVYDQFRKASTIEPVYDKKTRRQQRLDSKNKPSPLERAERDRDRMPRLARFIAENSVTEIAPDSGIQELKFVEQFMKSDDFLEHLNNVTAEAINRLGGDVPTGKVTEDGVREASVRLIGADDEIISTGFWAAPDGNEYHVEVMREHSETALFDLVLNVTDVKSGEHFQSSLQFKSYKNKIESEEMKAGDVKESKRRKIVAYGGGSTELPGNAGAIAKEVRVRTLATDHYFSIEPNIKTRDGVPVMVVNNSVCTHPEVHRAIATCTDLDQRFKPVRRRGRNGKADYFILRARVPVTNPDGGEGYIAITHDSKIKLTPSGRPAKRDGAYDMMPGGTGQINIDVPGELFASFSKQSFMTQIVAHWELDRLKS